MEVPMLVRQVLDFVGSSTIFHVVRETTHINYDEKSSRLCDEGGTEEVVAHTFGVEDHARLVAAGLNALCLLETLGGEDEKEEEMHVLRTVSQACALPDGAVSIDWDTLFITATPPLGAEHLERISAALIKDILSAEQRLSEDDAKTCPRYVVKRGDMQWSLPEKIRHGHILSL